MKEISMTDDEKGIIEKLTDICDEICLEYCKFSEESSKLDTDDDSFDKLIKEHCDKCPIRKI